MSLGTMKPRDRVLCVTLNAALDITYTASSVVLGEVNRVGPPHAHAGGKAVNVARLLHRWGRATSVLGLAGGPVGMEIATSLEEAGVPHRLVPCVADSRRTITVVNGTERTTTGFYEPGPAISMSEWKAFGVAYEAELADSRLVVLSGSLPPGVPGDAYRQLTSTARAQGLPVILDAHGKAMLHGLDAGPSLVTPNETELAEAAGLATPIPLDVAVRAARRLVADGAGRVVATLGPRGLVGTTAERTWVVVPPAIEGNPTGAGDAVVAVLADSELSGRPWPEALQHAAATAAAAVRAPAAGMVDPEDVAALWASVEVHEL